MEEWQDQKTGEPKHLGDLWMLEKRGRTVTCVLVAHPIGSEARLTLDGDFKRSAAFANGADAISEADGWRQQFEATGWAPSDARRSTT